jgi:hypothetical protein
VGVCEYYVKTDNHFFGYYIKIDENQLNFPLGSVEVDDNKMFYK